VWEWKNEEPFGNNGRNENPSGLGNFEYNLGFAGQYCDKETNTCQNWHRDYDPATGRYRQPDPIGQQGGLNLYGYVGGQPTKYADPTGLIVPALAIPFIGGSIGVGEMGIGLGLAAMLVIPSSSMQCEKDQEQKKESKCSAPTEQNIRRVLDTSNMMSYQQSVSMRNVQGMVATIAAGGSLPAMWADGNKIVDGNHRYVAWVLCNQSPAIQPWTAPLTKTPVPMRNLQIVP